MYGQLKPERTQNGGKRFERRIAAFRQGGIKRLPIKPGLASDFGHPLGARDHTQGARNVRGVIPSMAASRKYRMSSSDWR